MALAGSSLLAVEVKCLDPQDSADLLRQIPLLCLAFPPSGLVSIGALLLYM